ncbi:MAG: uroporphyrinogen decarboxylase family protein [Anaerolineae bacterium]|nr:hypothetical protein [Chloroflexota bacterium]
MSRAIAAAALNLEPVPRLAHTEYCSHAALKRRVTGIDQEGPEQERAFLDAWDIDLIWHTDDGPVDWSARGRTTDMGHAEFLEAGRDRRSASACPFHSVEEALAVDAVAEFGLHPQQELIAHYQRSYDAACVQFPNQLHMGGYYKTLISGAIALYGWDMLLQAAAQPVRFARVLDSVYRQTRHHAEAWAQTSIQWFMCHDDMVWSQGPFMRPAFYREEIIPRYADLFALLHRAGKRVIFTSDGDMSLFVDDLVEAGADALCFEALTPLEPVVERYGQTHALLSSKVDARTLTFGNREGILAEVRATVALGRRCRGLVAAVGNHIPSNVPVANALYYMDTLRSMWSLFS